MRNRGVGGGRDVADTQSNAEQNSPRQGALQEDPAGGRGVCVLGTTQQNPLWGLLPSGLVFFIPPLLPEVEWVTRVC